jgi:hypothetical protein
MERESRSAKCHYRRVSMNGFAAIFVDRPFYGFLESCQQSCDLQMGAKGRRNRSRDSLFAHMNRSGCGSGNRAEPVTKCGGRGYRDILISIIAGCSMRNLRYCVVWVARAAFRASVGSQVAGLLPNLLKRCAGNVYWVNGAGLIGI